MKTYACFVDIRGCEVLVRSSDEQRCYVFCDDTHNVYNRRSAYTDVTMFVTPEQAQKLIEGLQAFVDDARGEKK